jgi:acetoin utilization deacetylase AcuC-like enzyme
MPLRPSELEDLVYTERYALPQATARTVPQDPQRGERILTFLLAEGLIRRAQIHRPRAVSLRSLRRVHTDTYLESLHTAEVWTRVVGEPLGEEEAHALLRLQRFMVGGTNLAARLALDGGGVAANLGGGLHHAHADEGRGFCLFNDVAVTIASLRHHGFAGPILVVDLDVHHGDGTEAIFTADSTVHTFSIHNQDWGRPEAVEATRIELGHGVEDALYLETLRTHLPPLVERFRPRFAFYLAGTAPAAGDRIGDWKITPEALLERDRFVFHQLRGTGRNVPTVILPAGGYGDETWRYTARFLGALCHGGRVVEPPSTDEITLMRYRSVAREIDPKELTGIEAEDDWGLTEEDLLGLASTPRETRFLGYYSRHGIEVVLERYGLLDRLRALGFRDFQLKWELEDPSGQTLRLFANSFTGKSEGSGERYLLVELRARRDRSTVPGMELLRVEWLLLQNPCAPFPPKRSPLPGQEHPGLGLLREMVALLVVVCERLHLDGLSFVPGHYHLAQTSSNLLRFLRPQDRALFEALHRIFEGHTLAEASRALDAGRVVNAETGEPLEWPRPPMVLPVSDRLKRWLEEEDEAGEASALPSLRLAEAGH